MTAYKLIQLLVNGYRELTRRRLPWVGHRVWAAIGVALLASACQAPDITFGTERSGVEFVLGGKEDPALKSALAQSLLLEDARSVVLSIKDSTGALVHDNKQIQLDTFDGNYQSQVLSLLPGAYELTHFQVLDGNNLTLYAAPLEGSELAYLVKDPLSISFIVSKDAVTTVNPEVLSTAQRTPEDFGYVIFDIDVVEVLDFLVAVFVQDASSESLVLSPAQLEVANGLGQILYSGNLQASTTRITVPAGHTEYKVTIDLPGYEPYMKTFSGTELVTYFSSTQEGPLEVVLRGLLSSCQELLAAGRSTGNGWYFIDPDGTAGPIAPQQVYCDMETHGGGWTAVDPDLASALGATAMNTLGTNATCKVNTDTHLFEAYYAESYNGTQLVCQYDVRLGFSFTEIRVSADPGNVLTFISMATKNTDHTTDIVDLLNNDWGVLVNNQKKGDINIGTPEHLRPVLSLGQALGLEHNYTWNGPTITWPETLPVSTTADKVLRIQYAESGTQGEGVSWTQGRIFVR